MKQVWIFWVMAAVLAGAATVSAQSSEPADTLTCRLEIHVTGFDSNQGQAKLALVNSREHFESEDSQFMGINSPVINRQVRLTLTVPRGEYAVKVYHDENNNDQLDTRMFGIPAERYGFSHNVRGTLGPPDYSDARFVLDTAEHAMPQMILEDLGLWKHLDVAYTPELWRIITDCFDITLPAKDPDGVKARLSKQFPHEKKGIHGFYTQMEQVISALWGGGASQNNIMGKLENLTLSQWMDQHVSDPDVKTCMAVFSGYYGQPPEELNALFYAIATGEYLVHGGQYYKARSQDLSNTLAQGIRNFNGRIHFNTRASQILFNPDKTLTGVSDHKGTVCPAKAVIANCPVPALVNSLVPPAVMPTSFAAQAQQRRPSLSSFVVWLGLNQPVPGIRDYEIDLAGTADPSGNDLFNKADLAESGIGITLYDNLFKGYSPEGKTTMTIICLSDYARWQKFENDYFNNQKQAYNREKERIAARFIQRVEKALIPGLSGMIEEMEVGTPLTNVFYTGNTGGAIYGYDRNLPHLESSTPVNGLYLASAWSHGGGYTPVMMGGTQTAQQVTKDFSAVETG